MGAVARARARYQILTIFLENKTKRHNRPGLNQSHNNELDSLQLISPNRNYQDYKRTK